MSVPIRMQHDFNDRLPDGTYKVWLQPGTRITLFDSDGTEVECFVPYSHFIVLESVVGITATTKDHT